MSWVLERTASSRRFSWVPTACVNFARAGGCTSGILSQIAAILSVLVNFNLNTVPGLNGPMVWYGILLV